MFLFQHTPDSEPGSLSYMLGCVGQGLAIAVDVHQDEVELYLEKAAQKGVKIAYVVDTHELRLGLEAWGFVWLMGISAGGIFSRPADYMGRVI